MRCAHLWLIAAGAAFAGNANSADLPGVIKFGAGATVAFDVAELDLRNDMHVLNGNIHVAQGPTSIDAAHATASALQSSRSKWTFDKDVHIRTADTDLKSDVATAAFTDGKITTAVAKGTPAFFEQRRGTPDKLVKGRAGIIDYDVTKGIVTMKDQVWFSYGGNEFRSNLVVYNIRDERVTVNPGGRENGRVNITIKPRTLDKKPGNTTPATPSSGDGA